MYREAYVGVKKSFVGRSVYIDGSYLDTSRVRLMTTLFAAKILFFLFELDIVLTLANCFTLNKSYFKSEINAINQHQLHI